MSPRDIREIRIVFDDLSVRSADPEEGGEVVHRVEPSVRRYSPEETPEGQRGSSPRPPSPPRPPATLYCRGPLAIGLWSPMGLLASFDYNDTEAGVEGEKLAPGHAALQDRPLTPDEPNQILISKPDANWPVEDLISHGISLSVVANLLSRSDYVVPLFATQPMWQLSGWRCWFTSTTDLVYERFSPFSP